MKRLFVLLVVCVVCVPLVAGAEDVSWSGDQAKVSVKMGREVVYLDEGLISASFQKDAEHSFKHDLYYSCSACDKHQRIPGKCSMCGMDLTPSFKHGETWHLVNRDASGRLTVDNMARPAVSADAAKPSGMPAVGQFCDSMKGGGKCATCAHKCGPECQNGCIHVCNAECKAAAAKLCADRCKGKNAKCIGKCGGKCKKCAMKMGKGKGKGKGKHHSKAAKETPAAAAPDAEPATEAPAPGSK